VLVVVCFVEFLHEWLEFREDFTFFQVEGGLNVTSLLSLRLAETFTSVVEASLCVFSVENDVADESLSGKGQVIDEGSVCVAKTCGRADGVGVVVSGFLPCEGIPFSLNIVAEGEDFFFKLLGLNKTVCFLSEDCSNDIPANWLVGIAVEVAVIVLEEILEGVTLLLNALVKPVLGLSYVLIQINSEVVGSIPELLSECGALFSKESSARSKCFKERLPFLIEVTDKATSLFCKFPSEILSQFVEIIEEVMSLGVSPPDEVGLFVWVSEQVDLIDGRPESLNEVVF
jgi:hypothetical protein